MEHFIAVIDDVLPASLCDELIQAFEEKTQQQHPGQTGGGVDFAKKRSVDITLDQHGDWAELQGRVSGCVLPQLCAYAARYHFMLVGALSPVVRHPITGQPTTLDDNNFASIGAQFVSPLVTTCFRLGAMNLQRYLAQTGGYPHWHSEVYPQAASTEALHRVLFWICYLNDVALGGETEFAYQDVKVRARMGRLLIAPAGFTHTHRGNPSASTNKYVLASWLLYRPGAALLASPGQAR